ncbi:MAG TPA: ROK family protein [Candidatus Binataceae bacterium]|nr:ROK family protein [Candidatus Binataceae bacterium]
MKKATAAKPSRASAAKAAPRTLAIDIGGTGIKALTLDPAGKPLNDRTRIPTPRHGTPKAVIGVIRKLAKAQDGFERVSAGFPGVVKDGVIYTATNLGKGWAGFDLRRALEHKLKRPVLVANDADIQGLGCVSGHGLELVVTLGTGFGSVLFANGTRIHLELGHHPFHNGKTYEDELGERALKRRGHKRWNKMLAQAIDDLRRTFNYDALYLGGGNSRLVDLKLDADVRIVSNAEGLLGGIALWREASKPAAKAPGATTSGKVSSALAPKSAAKPARTAPVKKAAPAAVKAPVAAPIKPPGPLTASAKASIARALNAKAPIAKIPAPRAAVAKAMGLGDRGAAAATPPAPTHPAAPKAASAASPGASPFSDRTMRKPPETPSSGGAMPPAT